MIICTLNEKFFLRLFRCPLPCIFSRPKTNPKTRQRSQKPTSPVVFLDERELVGSNVESIDIRGQASVGLLGAIRADEGVDLDTVNVIELLEGKLDLGPVSRLDLTLILFLGNTDLLLLMSTMKTRVLFSSIFFIALSVLRGWTMI